MPLVELRTTHNVRLVSDNAGRCACDLPEVEGVPTWFQVLGQGYEIPADGFGLHGVRLTPLRGGKARVELTRTSVARRLGRLTGGGLFAESQRLGLGAPPGWRESGVLGSDSVQTALHGERQFWLWGDTTLPGYPLGIFNCSAAWTPRVCLPRLEPPLALEYRYFRDARGAPRGVADIPGPGPTWLTGLASLPGSDGKAHLVATYMKVEAPLTVVEWGLCIWDEAREQFLPLRSLWTRAGGGKEPGLLPRGHQVRWTDPSGVEWLLLGDPFPFFRVRARFEEWRDPSRWESLEPQASLLAAADGARVSPHSGSIAWSPHLHRWVTVFVESFGKPSFLGEVWYAESPSPTGPWGKAVKVLSHDNYTFYNPCVHAELVPEGSPVLLFEGTYTAQFADHPAVTPRHEYNQVLYRLDLDDARLEPARRP